jgi:hypothetical protein
MLLAVLGAGFCATPGARGQGVGGTNAVLTGPLAGVEMETAKVGFPDKMPAKLCGLLWPMPGTNQPKYAVKKVATSGASAGEKRVLIVRLDNGDIVLAHFAENTPSEDAKIRREIYFRTTSQGELERALRATFVFEITDVGNEVLRHSMWQAYGEMAGEPAGTNESTLAITADIKAQFEKEKKYWRKQEKNLKKQEQKQVP